MLKITYSRDVIDSYKYSKVDDIDKINSDVNFNRFIKEHGFYYVGYDIVYIDFNFNHINSHIIFIISQVSILLRDNIINEILDIC